MRSSAHFTIMLRRFIPTPWLRDFVFCMLVCVVGLAFCAAAAANAG
jgi:hypothetical protein